MSQTVRSKFKEKHQVWGNQPVVQFVPFSLCDVDEPEVRDRCFWFILKGHSLLNDTGQINKKTLFHYINYAVRKTYQLLLWWLGYSQKDWCTQITKKHISTEETVHHVF